MIFLITFRELQISLYMYIYKIYKNKALAKTHNIHNFFFYTCMIYIAILWSQPLNYLYFISFSLKSDICTQAQHVSTFKRFQAIMVASPFYNALYRINTERYINRRSWYLLRSTYKTGEQPCYCPISLGMGILALHFKTEAAMSLSSGREMEHTSILALGLHYF